MPDDSPKPSRPDGFEFADEAIEPTSPPRRELADYGTLKAELSKFSDENADEASDRLPIPSPPADFGSVDPSLPNLLIDVPSPPAEETPDAQTAGNPSEDVFELEGGEDSHIPDEPPLSPRARPAERETKSKPSEPRPVPRVDEVWSRGQEWGATLLLLGAIGFTTLLVTYFALSAGQWGFGFLLLCLGAIVFVALSYPIMITLERPVRMTPELAVRDFYAALSHHRPHFRRMWLLLSTTGRSSTRFGSFEGFVACWKTWLKELRGPGESAWTPLHFEIGNVKAGKSAGQTSVKIDYSLRIFLRGRRDGDPLAAFNLRQWTVRGPDGMWYLEDGTPPGQKDEAATDRKGVDT